MLSQTVIIQRPIVNYWNEYLEKIMKSQPIATMNDIFINAVVFPAPLHPAMIYRLRVSIGGIDFKFFDCKFNIFY